jgi:hypothetical protein
MSVPVSSFASFQIQLKGAWSRSNSRQGLASLCREKRTPKAGVDYDARRVDDLGDAGLFIGLERELRGVQKRFWRHIGRICRSLDEMLARLGNRAAHGIRNPRPGETLKQFLRRCAAQHLVN